MRNPPRLPLRRRGLWGETPNHFTAMDELTPEVPAHEPAPDTMFVRFLQTHPSFGYFVGQVGQVLVDEGNKLVADGFAEPAETPAQEAAETPAEKAAEPANEYAAAPALAVTAVPAAEVSAPFPAENR